LVEGEKENYPEFAVAQAPNPQVVVDMIATHSLVGIGGTFVSNLPSG